MELRQLHHFLAIVEHGSLGRAANALHLTEPALSKSIKRLEDSLQVSLFDRGTRGMSRTPFGDSFLHHARLIVGEIETTRNELDELRGVSRGVVKIGARPSFNATLLPRAIARIQARRPGVQAIVREGFVPTLMTEIIQGSLDFIVVTEVDDLDAELTQEPLAVSPVGLAVQAGHPLTQKSNLSPRDLAGAKWLLPLPSDPIRRQLDAALARNGLQRINVVAESNSVLFTVAYIRETGGIGFLPRAILEQGRRTGDLDILDVPQLAWQRQLNIVRRKRASLSPPARLLLQELRTVSAELGVAIAP
jgi:DNA-binding transcriptional LysR family regulator